MYAHVPSIPGLVTEIAAAAPTGKNSSDWYSCGDVVSVGWSFDGNTFRFVPAERADQPPPTIEDQIVALEKFITPRMMQEAILGSVAVFPSGSPYVGQTAAQAIATIRAQIAALRAQI